MPKLPAIRDPNALEVGYSPEALRSSIRRYAGIAERNLSALEQLDPKVNAAIKHIVETTGGATALDDAESLSIIYDRLVKAGLNLVKATDELARLQSFLDGGPDSRPDLSSMGEIELRGVLAVAIRALGVQTVQEIIDSTASASA